MSSELEKYKAIEELRIKIQRANPESDDWVTCRRCGNDSGLKKQGDKCDHDGCNGLYFNAHDITLEDILNALDFSRQGKEFDFLLGKNSTGNVFVIRVNIGGGRWYQDIMWFLGKILDEQPQYTIDNLNRFIR